MSTVRENLSDPTLLALLKLWEQDRRAPLPLVGTGASGFASEGVANPQHKIKKTITSRWMMLDDEEGDYDNFSDSEIEAIESMHEDEDDDEVDSELEDIERMIEREEGLWDDAG